MQLLQKQAEQMQLKEMFISLKGCFFCFTYSSADRIKINVRRSLLLVVYDWMNLNQLYVYKDKTPVGIKISLKIT